MGSSADAAIIYGFAFEGDGFDFDDEAYHEDPEVWLATHQGLPEGDDLPIGIEFDGSASCGAQTAYLCIREASLSGDWGRATEIPFGHVTDRRCPEYDNLLRAFCEKAGMPFVEPKWLLLASYG